MREKWIWSIFLLSLQYLNSNWLMKNKQFIYTLLLLLFMLSGCKKGKQEQTQKAIDTIPMLINEVQKCSKLYNVE